jgi:hypothetical protein
MAGISFGIFFPSAGIVKVLIRHMTKGVKSVGMRRDEKDASWLRHKLLKLWQVLFDFDSFVFTGRETSLFGVHEKNKNERFSLCQLHFIVSLCWRLMDRSHLKHCRFRRKAKTLRATTRFGFTLGCCLPHFKHRNYYRRYFYIRKGKKK